MKTGKRLVAILVAGIILCMVATAFGGKGNSNGNQNASGIAPHTPSQTATLQFMR